MATAINQPRPQAAFSKAGEHDDGSLDMENVDIFEIGVLQLMFGGMVKKVGGISGFGSEEKRPKALQPTHRFTWNKRSSVWHATVRVRALFGGLVN